MKSVILIGFMGSGKTTVGIQLSYQLQMAVEDTDKLIEQHEGRSISDIFAKEGEAYFRDLETKMLREICDWKHACILSVGGGTPVREENRDLLKKCGTVVYLRVRPETVYERVKQDTGRPLLQCEDPLGKIKTLLEARSGAYEGCADLIIDADDKTVKEIVAEIAGKLAR